MRLELNTAGHIGIVTNGRRGTFNRLLQVLHNKLHLLPLLGEGDRHEAVAAANVDKSAARSVNLLKVDVVDKVVNLVALAAGQAGHGAGETLCADGLFANGGKHGLLIDGVKGKGEAGAGERGGFGMCLEGVNGAAGRGEDVFGIKTDPVLEVGVFGEDARGGGMCDEAGLGLVEDVVCHGVSYDAGKVDGVEGCLGLQILVGDFAVHGDQVGCSWLLVFFRLSKHTWDELRCQAYQFCSG